MKDIDFDVLFRKAEELRAIFILGQRLIPFVEDVLRFVNDIKPLLDDIHVSMEENMNKMQNASRQLSKVTEATETATTEIIDIIGGLISKSGIISSNMKRLNELDSTKYDTAINILEIIYKDVTKEKGGNKYLPQLSDAIDILKTVDGSEHKKLFDSTGELLDRINNDSSAIMMSLQVQDITSQHIAAVNHLLETIQDKVEPILMKFQSSEVRSRFHKEKADDKTTVSTLHRPIAFTTEDDDASYFSQDDINALFAAR